MSHEEPLLDRYLVQTKLKERSEGTPGSGVFNHSDEELRALRNRSVVVVVCERKASEKNRGVIVVVV